MSKTKRMWGFSLAIDVLKSLWMSLWEEDTPRVSVKYQHLITLSFIHSSLKRRSDHLRHGWSLESHPPLTDIFNTPFFVSSEQNERAGLRHLNSPSQEDWLLLQMPFRANLHKRSFGQRRKATLSSNPGTWQSSPEAAFVITPSPAVQTSWIFYKCFSEFCWGRG